MSLEEERRRKERAATMLSLNDLDLIVEAMNYLYKRSLKWSNKTYNKVPRPAANIKRLAEVQETLQLVTLIRNVRTNQINEALKEAAGIQTASDIGAAKLDGAEEQTTPLS